MKLHTLILLFFIFAAPWELFAQMENAHNFSQQILYQGTGKVTIGDINNDGINDVIKIIVLTDFT